MGMYDYFECDTTCPVCSHPLTRFQTKSFERCMDTYRPGQRVNDRSLSSIRVYTHCDHRREFKSMFGDEMIEAKCYATWVEFTIPVSRGGIIIQDQNRWEREVKEVDYNGLLYTPGCYTEQDACNRIDAFNTNKAESIRITEIERKHHEDGYTSKD